MSTSSSLLDMQDLDLSNRRVLIREDLNVPIKDGKITSSARIQRALPTLKKALKAKARVMVLSHFGRPEEGKFDPAFSLAPVAAALSQALNQEVPLIKNYLDGVDVAPGQIVLCENVRFNQGENKNDPALSKRMAELCDVFVMDAFATAHRTQSSTVGLIEHAPIACAGPLLLKELSALSQALGNPKRPLLAIVGGSKISTKIQILDALMDKVDALIVGGAIANTFLAAAGYPIGKSLYEPDWHASAEKILETAKAKNISIPLPVDVVVAKAFSETSKGVIKNIADVAVDDMILDVGPETAKQYPSMMQAAGTIVWSGPVGVFEYDNFSKGTRALGEAIAASDAFSITGGGDTVSALDKFKLSDRISYVCTGGSAFLKYLEGKPLPAVAALQERAIALITK